MNQFKIIIGGQGIKSSRQPLTPGGGGGGFSPGRLESERGG